ncbi:MAG: hypothetical protein L6Q55_15945 [Azonexus sp.]|nr:hypothetical protein [Azonexus sp.]MCK6413895.1 hypothetical protein [Azonexus sp.]
MSDISTYFDQGTFALAAYSNLWNGMNPAAYEAALRQDGNGMSPTQAARFAQAWRVIDQFTDLQTGLSATVFQGIAGGPKFLAVRGTDPHLNDLFADGLLALGIPSKLNPQFTALRAQVEAWRANGTLGNSFSVAGHSLGGYLAAALKEAFPGQVTDAYMFNAPGVGGVVGSVANLFSSAFGLTGTASANVWNLRGSEGASVITGLGSQLSEPIRIQIEAATGLGFANHSIVRMTDALAIHALYAELFPGLNLGQIGGLVDASGARIADTLEGALDALRRLLLGGATPLTQADDRDALYANLQTLRGNAAYQNLKGAAATLLTGLPAGQIATLARADTADGIAVRYALQALNPFAVTAAGYAIHNTGGALDLYNDATGNGALSDQYLTDRANLLERKLWFSTQDIDPVNPAYAHNGTDPDFLKDDTYFEDAGSGYRIAQGFQPGAPHANIQRYYFGDAGGNSYAGGGAADRLYGGGGDDVLYGFDGANHLEGNAGKDIIAAGDGDDLVLGGDGDDALAGQGGNDFHCAGRDSISRGGRRDERYIGGRGDCLLLSCNLPSTEDTVASRPGIHNEYAGGLRHYRNRGVSWIVSSGQRGRRASAAAGFQTNGR